MNTIDFVKNDLNDLACHQGATFSVDLVVSQGETGLPDNLGGYSATMEIYGDDLTDDIASIVGTISDPSTGIVNFTISAIGTALLPVGLYNHYIQLSIGATIYRISYGAFEVLQ